MSARPRPSHARDENASGIPIKPCYDPADAAAALAAHPAGEPGSFPFTRGLRADGYRGRHWTMRQYAGFATAAESNARYRYLLARGTTGLSVAFDLPTQLGYDSDAPQARGEVGKVGVAIDSVTDMETLFDGIPLDAVTVSMTINAPGLDPARDAARRRAAARHSVRQARRHDSERRAQRVRGARYLHLPAAPFDAPRDRRDGVLRRQRAAVEYDLDLRLPHSRGGLDGRRRDRVHALQREGIPARGARGRPRHRPHRAAHLLLLERAQRFLRRGRQVPRGARALGEDHAR